VTRDEFSRLVGGTLIHMTLAKNAAGIAAHGLKPAAQLALEAGVEPEKLVLRRDRTQFRHPQGNVTLNNQSVLNMGRAQAFLDGITLEDWSRQLDTRTFFWPASKGAAFNQSLPQDVIQYRFDAKRFFDRFAPDIYLSPINSGNAMRRPAWRGNWLYVPVHKSATDFTTNRQQRGLVRGRDSVVEVSIHTPIPAQTLITLQAASDIVL